MSEKPTISSFDMTVKCVVAERSFLFYVPNYQRHYVWTEKEVAAFLKDGEFCWDRMREAGEKFQHFTGQLILRETGKDKSCHAMMEIVDGQQRLTTFTQVVTAAIRVMRARGVPEKRCEELIGQYLFKENGQYQVLTLSKQDEAVWEGILDLEQDPQKIKAEGESQTRLLNAEKQIRGYFEGLTEGKGEQETYEILSSYVEAMASCFQVVLLKTDKPGYTYALYQIVNDRGIPLTSGELLKARTMELLNDKPDLAKRAEEMWNDILSDPGNTTDRYLIWNYAAVLGRQMEARTVVPAHEQYEHQIFKCWNKRILSEIEQKHLFDELEQFHINVTRMRVLEKGLMTPERSIGKSTKIMYEALISTLKNTSVIPLYLKILEMDARAVDSTLEKITPLLAKAFFMAKTVGGLHDEAISKCYMEIWKKIGRSHADITEIEADLKRLLDRENCRNTFFTRINEEVYSKGSVGSKKAKFLLLMLEIDHWQCAGSGKDGAEEDSVQIDIGKLSIEHILPEEVDDREVSKQFYNSIHRIGNLTLLGRKLNSRQRNKAFADKAEIYKESPYWVTRHVGALKKWTWTEFKERQNQMQTDYKRIFNL